MVVVHICGAPSSGKTTLGLRLKRYYKTRVIVQELADLEEQFIQGLRMQDVSAVSVSRNYKKLYQAYIADYIKRTEPTHIIFIGSSIRLKAASVLFKTGTVTAPVAQYDISARHCFYITLPHAKILKQRYYRDFDGCVDQYRQYLLSKKDAIFNGLSTRPAQEIQTLTSTLSTGLFNFAELSQEMTDTSNIYRIQGYQMLSPGDIYSKIRKIIV